MKLLHPHPALLLSEGGRRHLLISDLHIGFEERYAAAGVNIQGSIEAMSETLSTLIKEQKPDRLIILGDIKYSINRIGNLEWREVPPFFEQVSKKVKITIIPGNHDGKLTPLLPRNMTLLNKPSLLIGKNALIHGHMILSDELLPAKRIIMGHIHPRYSRRDSPLSGKPVWLILKVEKNLLFKEAKNEDLDIYVLPAFNQELTAAGFTARRGSIISPVIRRIRENIREAIVITLEGDILGSLESLEYVL